MLCENHPSPPDQQVVIVSFFGKSSYISRGYKGNAVDDALGHQVFCSSVLDSPQVDGDAHVMSDGWLLSDTSQLMSEGPMGYEPRTEIKGYLDAKQKVLYLHLCGTFDIRGLADIYEKLKTDLGSEVAISKYLLYIGSYLPLKQKTYAVIAGISQGMG
ncbi:tRNA-cytidine(32) 2-sulfurtransferase [Frankliniella fusca]|uniref:tRNA-cytidine(32) 2-sulfurtransferase n=1 Tax=Frankliniella fusca TaxID=407009 RepID=A0AAE1HIL3_9NEOP|nr:tRNA-cytidine(32) 2-sulfurtransferase [Frankliniella fusca]